MIAPEFSSDSRVMLLAPHPDDESLACSVILQQAVRAGAAVRVVYVTDGDDNPWPQRVLERKWRINAADRGRWGKLRRTEAQAALQVLGLNPTDAQFLGLPDQGLTELLLGNCEPALSRLAELISQWSPTDLLSPSRFDTHPDHSAVALMSRLLMAEHGGVTHWNYLVHGKSEAFSDRATKIGQTKAEVARKCAAIRCHKTQISLSRRRFLSYSKQPERFVRVGGREALQCEGSIRSITRERKMIRLGLRLVLKPWPSLEKSILLLGCDHADGVCAFKATLPTRSGPVDLVDGCSTKRASVGFYRGNAFAGDLEIPLNLFSAEHPIFFKFESRSWFFDEAGWLELPALPVAKPISRPRLQLAGAAL